MNDSSRRGYLKSIASTIPVFAAGCAALDNIGRKISQDPTPTPSTPTRGSDDLPSVNIAEIVGIDQTINIDAGQYKYWEKDISEILPTSISSTVVVRSGPPVDYILTDSEELQALQDGKRAAYFESSVLQTTLVDEESRIEETENLVILVDNSGLFQPQERRSPVEVEVEVNFD